MDFIVKQIFKALAYETYETYRLDFHLFSVRKLMCNYVDDTL